MQRNQLPKYQGKLKRPLHAIYTILTDAPDQNNVSEFSELHYGSIIVLCAEQSWWRYTTIVTQAKKRVLLL